MYKDKLFRDICDGCFTCATCTVTSSHFKWQIEEAAEEGE